LRLFADRDEPLLGFVVRRGAIAEETAREAIARGGAFVQGKRVRDPGRALRSGDRVELRLRAERAAPLSQKQLLHLDPLIVAVDKPAGVAAQEDLSGGDALPDLCSALLASLGEKPQALLVHRLDRGTTGVTLLARTRRAQAALLAEFRAQRVTKEYRALVSPAPRAEEGTSDIPVGSRPALTRWRVLERYPDAAMISAHPATGRTHQIRVHLAAAGCPLLGDKEHGGPALLTRPSGARHDFLRPMLHALSLSFRHPDGRTLRIDAPLAADFKAAQAFLRA
jgi:23S rRNA pseudouridine1911/1915/1917 synthase